MDVLKMNNIGCISVCGECFVGSRVVLVCMEGLLRY